LAFLFFNGAAGGILGRAPAGLTFGATCSLLDWSLDRARGYTSSRRRRDRFPTTVGGADRLYISPMRSPRCSFTGIWLGRRPPRLAGVLALIIPGLLAVGPNLVLFFINRLTWMRRTPAVGQPVQSFVVKEPADRRAPHLLPPAGC
jgi:hypothetical protein